MVKKEMVMVWRLKDSTASNVRIVRAFRNLKHRGWWHWGWWHCIWALRDQQVSQHKLRNTSLHFPTCIHTCNISESHYCIPIVLPHTERAPVTCPI